MPLRLCNGLLRNARLHTAASSLPLHRCSFVDIAEALQVESRTAVIEHCDIAAYDRCVARGVTAQRLHWSCAPRRRAFAASHAACEPGDIRFGGPLWAALAAHPACPLAAAAACRGPVIVTCGRIGGEVEPGDHEDINSKLLYLEVRSMLMRRGSAWNRAGGLCAAVAAAPVQQQPHVQPTPPHAAPVLCQDALPDLPVYMCEYLDAKATGTRATEEQHAAVEAGGVVEGHVVLWANTAFESRSNDNITAQQEEVRREVGARLQAGVQCLGLHGAGGWRAMGREW